MRFFLCLLAVVMSLDIAHAASLVEPALRLPPSRDGNVRVALTLDACDGRTDMRILDTLVEQRIPATIFATGRWLRRNKPALEIMLAHPDLFEVENHGMKHVPAVDTPTRIYGIRAAGSADAVRAEVQNGGNAVAEATGRSPKWFRGATAKYTTSSMSEIRELGQRVAGYSINGDGGSLLGARSAERRIAAAGDGDVIIAHINQPGHKAGAGGVKGILDLKARGVEFTRLDALKDDPGADRER